MKVSRIIAAISGAYLFIILAFPPQRTPQQIFAVPSAENSNMVRFHLREPGSKRPTAIILYYYYDGQRFVASTRRKISPQDWDPRRMRPKASYPSAQSLTAYLNSLQAAIIDKHNYLLAIGRYPTPDDFRQAIAERSGRVNIGRPTLMAHLDALVEKAPPHSQYRNLRKQLSDFLKAKRMPTQMEALNAAWFDAFQAYLIANCAEGYAYRVAKQFKTAIRAAGFDWEGKGAILAAELRASATPSEKVYLSFDELRSIPPGEVGNMLYLACITGLRISDWGKYSLSGDVIDCGEFRFVRILQQKTGGVAFPPLLPAAENILRQHGGNFLPHSWAHRASAGSLRILFNAAAREAAKAAGIDTPTTLLKKQRGGTSSTTGPKWQFVSSKVGRNTFITLFRTLGTPDNLLNLMTGHAGMKGMADAYDVAGFKERAPLLFPYLREFSRGLNPDAGIISIF